MLNDYGKSLFRPWMSVQNCVLAIAAIFTVALFKPSSGELASWVQAIGSIAAIWGALKVVSIQHVREQQRSVNAALDRAESLAVLIREATQQSSFFSDIVQRGTSLSRLKEFLRQRIDLSRITLGALEAVSLREFESPVLLSIYLEITASMAKMYGMLNEIRCTMDETTEEYENLCASIVGNNMWLQKMSESFEAAHIERIEELKCSQSNWQ